MKPTKLTVYELFQQQKRYVVPLYQRPYVWSMNEQWEPLWEDIEGKAAAFLAGDSANPHFLGAVVLNQVATFGRQIAASQVIDGQQRLTTLQVFLTAFRDIMAEQLAIATDADQRALFEGIHFELDKITGHKGLMESPIERFKVWPTNADRDFFRDVVSAGSKAALDKLYPRTFTGMRRKVPVPGPNLVEAYRFFYAGIRQFAEPHPMPESALSAAGGHPFLALFEAKKLSPARCHRAGGTGRPAGHLQLRSNGSERQRTAASGLFCGGLRRQFGSRCRRLEAGADISPVAVSVEPDLHDIERPGFFRQCQ